MAYLSQNRDYKQYDSENELVADTAGRERNHHDTAKAYEYAEHIEDRKLLLKHQNAHHNRENRGSGNNQCAYGRRLREPDSVSLTYEINEWFEKCNQKEIRDILLLHDNIFSGKYGNSKQNQTCNEDSDEYYVFDRDAYRQEPITPQIRHSP